MLGVRLQQAPRSTLRKRCELESGMSTQHEAALAEPRRSAAPHSAACHSAHLLPIAGWLQCLPRGACVQLKVGVSSRPIEGVIGLQRQSQVAGCGNDWCMRQDCFAAITPGAAS